ncbi:MAG: ATP-binding protein [Candidatus Cryosericum sp.]
MEEDRKTFYIGTEIDPATGQAGTAVLYPGNDLTTHGIIVGMTGSGKTGLSIDLIEEALMDGVPVIAIDPKGDLGNLLLTFPTLTAAEFQPWIDPAEAERKGLTIEQTAVATAETWQKGLAASGIAPERIAQLKAAADFVIFTPGSTAGIPVSVLQSFRRPAGDLGDEETQEKVKGVTSALLGLVGIEADPIRSREHILISSIINDTWGKGHDLTLPDLIAQLQNPPFEKLGVFEVDTFFPPKDRLDLAMRINGLIASPSFQSWLNGAPLDVESFLHAPDGRPRCSIFAIAHLSDAERMFFVTLFLQEVISWMRLQQGTDSLRALLYFDEVFGYFPPYPFNPPSKVPLLTLMKQARAFGLGVLLATQNPVDIDYKGLSNAGTWIIGTLQQEGDRERVLGGLEGALQEGGGTLDRAWFTGVLGSLKPRQFLLHNIHTDKHIVVQSRFAMSYLRGPLTKMQIAQLMAPRKQEFETVTPEAMPTTGPSRYLPAFPDGVPVQFAPVPAGTTVDPYVFGEADVAYEDKTTSAFVQQHLFLTIPASQWSTVDWSTAEQLPENVAWSDKAPDGVLFQDVPADLQKPASWKTLTARFKDTLKVRPLTLLTSKVYKVAQQDNETEDQFMARLGALSAADITGAVNDVQGKLAEKQRKLQDELTEAQQRLNIAQMDARNRTATEVVQGAETVLGLFMKRSRSISAVTRSYGAAQKQKEKAGDLQQQVNDLQQQIEVLAVQMQASVAAAEQAAKAKYLAVDQKLLRPKVSNIVIKRVGIVFR